MTIRFHLPRVHHRLGDAVMVALLHDSPAAFVQRQHRKARLRWLKRAAIVLAVIGALVAGIMIAGCSSGPSAQDQADLVRVGTAVDMACTAAALSPEDCTAAREALVRLGVSLEDVSKARIAAGVWDTLQPVIAAAIGWLLAGGA